VGASARVLAAEAEVGLERAGVGRSGGCGCGVPGRAVGGGLWGGAGASCDAWSWVGGSGAGGEDLAGWDVGWSGVSAMLDCVEMWSVAAITFSMSRAESRGGFCDMKSRASV